MADSIRASTRRVDGVQRQPLDKGQATAVETAVKRARFEMGYPDAKGQVLSRQIIQPVLNAPARGLGGVERAEYTVGVEGCRKRMTKVVVCAVDGTGCFAAEGRR